MIAPNSTIRLLKSNLELDNSNQLTFSNLSAQTSYFLSKEHFEVEDATYQRKDNVIRFPALIDDIITYNYVMYKNESYSNKWFYAYIESMEYLNDNMTLIKIKTDVFQTWQFDIVYKKSFVEREHVNDDTIGNNTTPENLETGEFVTLSTPTKLNNFNNGCAICVCVSDFPNGVSSSAPTIVNNVYSGLRYCIFSHSNGITTEAEWVNEFISMYDSSSKAAAISSIFMIPKEFAITDHAQVVAYNGDHFFYIPNESFNINTLVNSVSVNINTTLGGNYSPKNKKLFTSEFNYFVLSNNAGGDITMNYEDFISNTPTFKIIGSVTPGCSIKCIPLNYKKIMDSSGSMNSYNFGLSGAKLPICSWVNDTFTNWLTQNGVNIGIDVAGSVLTGLVGGPTAAVGSAINIANTLGSVYQHSRLPDQAHGNLNSGDVNFSSGNAVFTVYQMGVREEYARRIDDFFTMYGYKVNSLKVPNVTGRRNWNYVKTIGVNLEGAIPQDDVQELKSIFNNGVTFWHNGSNFLDYSQNNDII